MTAALDALDRLDFGTPQPGDCEAVEVYERECRQRAEVLQARLDIIEREAWLATQCPMCVEGGSGLECDACFIAYDAVMRRAEDQ